MHDVIVIGACCAASPTAMLLARKGYMLFGALRGNQADTNQFFGTFAVTVCIPEFFAPANVGRIMSAARARTASA